MSAVDLNIASTEFLKWWCEENKIEAGGTKRNLIKRISEDPKLRAKCLFDLNSQSHKESLEKMASGGKVEYTEVNVKVNEGESHDKETEVNNNNENDNGTEDVMEFNNQSEKCTVNDGKIDVTSDNGREINKMQNVLTENRKDIELQLEIQRKQHQIVELENEMRMLKMRSCQNTENGAASFGIPFDVIKEMISTFDGHDQVDVWLAQLKNVISCYKLDDNIVRALICNKMKDKAKEWLHLHSQYLIGPIDELILNIQQTFKNKVSKLAIRQKLQDRKWQSGESFTSYYNEKCNLANSIGLEDDEFIEYLINGIPDINLRNTARLQCFATKLEFLQAFRNVELSTNKTSTSASRGEIKCFNCNSKGHIASECRKPKRGDGACFACGEVGHQAKDCMLYKKGKDVNRNEYNVK